MKRIEQYVCGIIMCGLILALGHALHAANPRQRRRRRRPAAQAQRRPRPVRQMPVQAPAPEEPVVTPAMPLVPVGAEQKTRSQRGAIGIADLRRGVGYARDKALGLLDGISNARARKAIIKLLAKYQAPTDEQQTILDAWVANDLPDAARPAWIAYRNSAVLKPRAVRDLVLLLGLITAGAYFGGRKIAQQFVSYTYPGTDRKIRVGDTVTRTLDRLQYTVTAIDRSPPEEVGPITISNDTASALVFPDDISYSESEAPVVPSPPPAAAMSVSPSATARTTSASRARGLRVGRRVFYVDGIWTIDGIETEFVTIGPVSDDAERPRTVSAQFVVPLAPVTGQEVAQDQDGTPIYVGSVVQFKRPLFYVGDQGQYRFREDDTTMYQVVEDLGDRMRVQPVVGGAARTLPMLFSDDELRYAQITEPADDGMIVGRPINAGDGWAYDAEFEQEEKRYKPSLLQVVKDVLPSALAETGAAAAAEPAEEASQYAVGDMIEYRGKRYKITKVRPKKTSTLFAKEILSDGAEGQEASLQEFNPEIKKIGE